MRCIIITRIDFKAWKCTNILHAYVQYEDKVYKLVIDYGMLSKCIIGKLKLKS